jgi:MFS transporter, OFA family, oxalate/formate antiporter
MSQLVMDESVIKAGLTGERPARDRWIYYGWVMLPLSMATLIASSPGQTFGVSIFNEPMRLSLRLSHGQLAAAYMLGTLLGAIPIAFIGRQMDRYGLRATMLAVISLFSLACFFTSIVQGWLTLVVAFCFLRMLGPGALSLLSGNTLAFWFERRLGMVEGLRQLGMAVAMATIPAVNLWLVAHWGWRGAYGILGAGIWLVLFPATALLCRNRPADVGQEIDGLKGDQPTSPSPHPAADVYWGLTLAETLRTRSFWIVTSGMVVYALIHTAVFFCLVPIFQERGLSAGDAAAALTVFAMCLAVMQLVGGMLADRMRAPGLLFAGLAGLSVALVLLLRADHLATAILAAGMFGVAQGTYFGATHPLWARYFGRRHLGKIRGVLMTIMVASSSLGPLFAGLIRDWQGDFSLALIVFAVTPLPIAILSLLVAPPAAAVEK